MHCIFIGCELPLLVGRGVLDISELTQTFVIRIYSSPFLILSALDLASFTAFVAR
jgi:hypothetical protein